jgi:putative transcriptional regulator
MVEGALDALAIAEGNADPSTYRVHVPDRINVREVRSRTHMSQSEFAARFGIPLPTLRAWEQRQREPEGPARVLLTIIRRDHKTVERLLQRAAR